MAFQCKSMEFRENHLSIIYVKNRKALIESFASGQFANYTRYLSSNVSRFDKGHPEPQEK